MSLGIPGGYLNFSAIRREWVGEEQKFGYFADKNN